MKNFINISKKDNSVIKVTNKYYNNLSIFKNVIQNKKNSFIKGKETKREFGKEIINNSNLTKYSKKEKNTFKYSSDLLLSKISRNSINSTKSTLISKVNKVSIKKGFRLMKFDKIQKPLTCFPKEKEIPIKPLTTINLNSNNDLMEIEQEEIYSKTLTNENIINNYNLNIENEEKTINKNPQLVEEYIDEIYNNLKLTETQFLPLENYMEKIQKDITERMRLILLDWLIEVHLKFKLLPETLFITINIIDRYLSIRDINRKYLQLLGVSSMFIACKYEEIYSPEIKDFIYMTDNAYDKNQMINMENDILKVLDFNICVPSYFRFLEIYKFYLKFDDKFFFLCNYLIEVALIEYNLIKFQPSLITTSAIFIALKIYNKDNIICNFEENDLWNVSKLNFDNVRDCVIKLIYSVEKLEKSKYLALKKKFSSEKFMCVSKNNLKFNESFLL